MDTLTDIELGDIARDTITGFEGVCVGEFKYLHGCRRLMLQSKDLHEGKPVDAITFDELQLALVSTTRHQADRSTGGPRPDPTRPDPVR